MTSVSRRFGVRRPGEPNVLRERVHRAQRQLQRCSLKSSHSPSPEIVTIGRRVSSLGRLPGKFPFDAVRMFARTSSGRAALTQMPRSTPPMSRVSGRGRRASPRNPTQARQAPDRVRVSLRGSPPRATSRRSWRTAPWPSGMSPTPWTESAAATSEAARPSLRAGGAVMPRRCHPVGVS